MQAILSTQLCSLSEACGCRCVFRSLIAEKPQRGSHLPACHIAWHTAGKIHHAVPTKPHSSSPWQLTATLKATHIACFLSGPVALLRRAAATMVALACRVANQDGRQAAVASSSARPVTNAQHPPITHSAAAQECLPVSRRPCRPPLLAPPARPVPHCTCLPSAGCACMTRRWPAHRP